MPSISESVVPLAVIAAPLLWPIAAILQLLFPVILRDRLRAYRWACAALVTESVLLILNWILDRVWPGHVPADGFIWTLVAVTVAAALAAAWQRPEVSSRPLRVEWLAFAALLVLFGGRATVAAATGTFEWNLGAALGTAAAFALVHLGVRRLFSSPVWLSTQRLFLVTWCLASVMAAYQPHQSPSSSDGHFMSDDWPTFRFDARRTGSTDAADAGPKLPHVLWRFRCPGDARLYASPVVVGSEIIAIATQSDPTGGRLFNRLYRLDATSGKLIGSIELPRAGISSPAVRGPLVIVGEGYHEDRDCHLRVVDRRSGTVVGSLPTTSHVESSPALDGNKVYFGAGEDGVIGIELTDEGLPRPLWHRRGDHVDASPAVAGGAVYVGSVTGDAGQSPVLIDLDLATGGEIWRVPTALPAIAAPAVDSDRVYFALGNGKLNRDAERPAGALWCLSTKTGERLWEVRSPASLYASPVCSDKRVVIARGDGIIQCLHQVDGREDWQASVGGRVVSGPVVSGGAVYVLAESGLLVRLDATTGRERWRFSDLEEAAPAGDVRASPVLAGGRLFVAVGGYLFCIGDRGE
jgi:outer membrane protein assembly factor BamB